VVWEVAQGAECSDATVVAVKGLKI